MRYIISLFLLFYLVFLIGEPNYASNNKTTNITNGVALTNDNPTTLSNKSALRGIVLLEEISQKLHNTTQVAMLRQAGIHSEANADKLEVGKVVVGKVDTGILASAKLPAAKPGFGYYPTETALLRKGVKDFSITDSKLKEEREQQSNKKGISSGISSPPQWQISGQNQGLDYNSQVSLAPAPLRGAGFGPTPIASSYKSPRPFCNSANRISISPSVPRVQPKLASVHYAPGVAPSIMVPGSLPQPVAANSFRANLNKQNIALLPPTVIKGIPLANLGDSEATVLEAIAKNRNLVLKKENIRNWSVWSIYDDKKQETSVQIFFRKQTVEAIRIFDFSHLRPNSGAKLGDNLSTIKMNFGEPAFILTEKNVRQAQNYIYPLSQVAFQFAKPSANESPVLTNLLIFNVQ